MKKYSFLITGMARSGTTLLDRLINNHPRVIAISQPLPKLYRHIKSVFLKEKGYADDYYVLGDLFLENRYSRTDFLDFLEGFKIERRDIEDVLESMKGWSGQYSNVDEEYLLSGEGKSDLYGFYNHFLEKEDSEELSTLGTKEIIIEEYVEYFLNKGVKVIFIIRDPRDVLTSLNVGSGPEYGGVHRPTLFHLRNWRKSISIANTFLSHPNLHLVKYETLITSPTQELNNISEFLGTKAFGSNLSEKGPVDNDGSTWHGNSSTDSQNGVNPNNSKKYKKYLSSKTIEYIEYICELEMKFHGYDLESNELSTSGFEEPFEIGNCGLDKMMSTDEDELTKESERKRLLHEINVPIEKVNSFFYSSENYQALSSAFKK